MSKTEKIPNESVGIRIRKLRKSHGEMQKDLAEALNKSESAVRMWELGKSEPDIETLKLIANRYSVSVSYLVDDNCVSPSMTFLSPKEQRLIIAYRERPEMQAAVNRLLNVDSDEYVELYVAAESGRVIPDRREEIEKKKWERIKDAPESDDPLM